MAVHIKLIKNKKRTRLIRIERRALYYCLGAKLMRNRDLVNLLAGSGVGFAREIDWHVLL